MTDEKFQRDDFQDVDFDRDLPEDDGGVPELRPGTHEPDRFKFEIGVEINAALWFHNGDRARQLPIAKTGVRKALALHAKQNDAVLGPVRWEEREPLDAGVPPPPDIPDAGDLRLCVGAAQVVALTKRDKTLHRFSRDLEMVDLINLRKATRDSHKKLYLMTGQDPQLYIDLTDDEVDEIIDEHGARTQQRQIEKKLMR